MSRRVGKAAMFGVLAGLATAAVAVAVRPRGGTGVLVDWDDVRAAARAHLDQPATSGALLAAAEKRYRAMAGKLEKPLLEFVGRLPVGVQLARFEAVDREGWLDLNLAILSRVIDPVLEQGRVPNSLIIDAGRAGIDRYVGLMLGFLGRRVLGQYDPQLLGAEPVAADGLYLVETNVEEWAKKADLPGLDLKLQQYRRGEAFAKAIYDAHGMKDLNLAWQGPDAMPRVEELSNPEAWYRRVARA